MLNGRTTERKGHHVNQDEEQDEDTPKEDKLPSNHKVEEIIKRTKNNKSPGIDDITASMFKYERRELTHNITALMK